MIGVDGQTSLFPLFLGVVCRRRGARGNREASRRVEVDSDRRGGATKKSRARGKEKTRRICWTGGGEKVKGKGLCVYARTKRQGGREQRREGCEDVWLRD